MHSYKDGSQGKGQDNENIDREVAKTDGLEMGYE